MNNIRKPVGLGKKIFCEENPSWAGDKSKRECCLDREVRQRPTGREGIALGRGSSECKGPEVTTYICCI